ncbi:MAG: type II secretion system F family protein [Candidatus ainarchaeum sp.]|nr:type II secretion system F family protein [Candidatus ainarchaeum sp.]
MSNLMLKYKKILERNKIKLHPLVWIAIAVLIGIVGAVLIALLVGNYVFAAVTLIAIADIIIGLPIYVENKRTAQIEKFFPSALREMSDVLKSGGTYEYALREVSMIDYGPLTKELQKVLRRLEDGANFEDALASINENVDSSLVRKVITIILDSVRAGAGLADVLDEIAEDARNLYKLQQERRAKTTMQVLFIAAAGSVIAPAIFGLVNTLSSFLVEVSTSTGIVESVKEIAAAVAAGDIIYNVLLFYLFFESLISSVIIAYMRDRTASKALLYFPIFVFVGFIIFFLAKYATKVMLAGMI